MSKISLSVRPLLLGHAMGSAIGVSAKHTGMMKYPYHSSYSDYIANEWAVCTDIFILLLNSKKVDMESFVKKLEYWSKHGLPFHNDKKPSMYSHLMRELFSNKEYFINPIYHSTIIWERVGHNFSSAFPVSFCIPMALQQGKKPIQTLFKEIKIMCSLFCPDPRAIISCWHICMAIRLLIVEDDRMAPLNQDNLSVLIVRDTIPNFYPELMECFTTEEVGSEIWPDNSYIIKLKNDKYVYDYITEYGKMIIDIPKLKLPEVISKYALDDFPTAYSYKLLAACIYTLSLDLRMFRSHTQKRELWRQVITEFSLISKVHPLDSDLFCGVVGSILTLRLGVECLPIDWINYLPNKNYLDSQIEEFQTMNIKY